MEGECCKSSGGNNIQGITKTLGEDCDLDEACVKKSLSDLIDEKKFKGDVRKDLGQKKLEEESL